MRGTPEVVSVESVPLVVELLMARTALVECLRSLPDAELDRLVEAWTSIASIHGLAWAEQAHRQQQARRIQFRIATDHDETVPWSVCEGGARDV